MTELIRIVVIGGCNFDYLVRGSKLPAAGETIDGETFQAAPGGKGANQAVAAARLGAQVTFIGRIGNDPNGRACVAQLKSEGVNADGIIGDDQDATGVALVMVDENGHKQIMTAPGANRKLSVDDVRSQKQLIQTAKLVLSQLEIPVESVIAAFRLCKEQAGNTVLDPAPAVPLPDALLQLVDVIRPNAAEAEILTGIRVVDRTTARKAAQQLIERGVRAAIVQAGDEGDLAVWRDGEQWLPRLDVVSVDATGAGDAFAAALAVRLAEGESIGSAAVFANAAAALATTRLGAQASLPTRDEVHALLKKSLANG